LIYVAHEQIYLTMDNIRSVPSKGLRTNPNRDHRDAACDYRDAIENAQKGDFIYLDPPYEPLNNTSYFTAYTKDGFDDRDQSQLAEVFRKLNIKALYSDFSIKVEDA
jgi:16S rRNA G966 N2-methylase RsmD